MDGTKQRRALERLIEEKRGDYAGLSRLIGKNPAYIQQFIKRGTPRRLCEDDRRTIAQFFGVNELVLGSPISAIDPGDRKKEESYIAIERLAVGASAGGGAEVGDERASGRIAFDSLLLRQLGIRADAASLITVQGDSMEPTLSDGDDIMVDRAAATGPLRDGIHVIRMDGTLMVKRLAQTPGGRLSVLSDNSAYPPIENVAAGAVEIIGRVVWAGRRL